jgi:hypothetical protein
VFLETITNQVHGKPHILLQIPHQMLCVAEEVVAVAGQIGLYIQKQLYRLTQIQSKALAEVEEVAEAVQGTLVVLGVLEGRAEQEHRLLSIAYQYPQEQQHPLQWLLQEVKLSYHGTHNEI